MDAEQIKALQGFFGKEETGVLDQDIENLVKEEALEGEEKWVWAWFSSPEHWFYSGM